MPTHRRDRDLSRLNLSELRELTGAGERTIRRRLEGLAPVAQDGRTLWYPAREALARVFLGEELNLSKERARLAKEQADKLARENAIERREIGRIGDFERWAVRLCSELARRLDAMPSKAAPEAHAAETIASCEAAIRRHLAEARGELGDARFVVLARGAAPAPMEGK